MLSLATKYFCIIFCSIFAYVKLLNIRIAKKFIITWFGFTVVATFIVCFSRKFFPTFTLIVIASLLILFVQTNYKKAISVNISASIISIGLSYLFFSISVIIIAPIDYLLYFYFGSNVYLNTITPILFSCLQFILLYILFHLKRFKNGLPFLETKTSNDIGAFISIFLLLVASFFYVENRTLTISTILIFVVILFGVILILWWRSLITNSYLEKLHKREAERYEKTIEAQQQEIDNLKLHNDALAKIIHKDNKLIPAMELAVKDFLRTASTDDKELEDKASSLINQLESLSGERKGIIRKYETTNKTLPVTGVASTDAVMKYLLHRANESDTLFDLSVTGNIKYMISNVISENDLNTLISDLGENALIATKELAKGSVLITLGIDDEHYCLKIYDNAAYFDANVIRSLGKSRYTTRALTGGSGIGLMTTFELLRKYNASFEIDECISHEIFTKCVSVRFDSNLKLRVRSVREEIAEVFTTKYKLPAENTADNSYFETNINNADLQ